MPTAALFRHVLEEARELVKAEVAQAKAELKAEATAAAWAAALLGGAAGLTLAGLAVLLAALGHALPLPGASGLVVVGGSAVVLAVGLAFLGYRFLPLQPMARTQEGLKRDAALARGRLS